VCRTLYSDPPLIGVSTTADHRRQATDLLRAGGLYGYPFAGQVGAVEGAGAPFSARRVARVPHIYGLWFLGE